MKTVYPQLFFDFHCLKGACPDSCCKGWEVDVDCETLEYYKRIPGGIKQRIDSVLGLDEYGSPIFRLAENQRCPFLNSADLCDIHIELGVQHTPLTCRSFPKFVNYYGALCEVGYSFSCPVAAKLMWQGERAFAFCEEITAAPPQLNDIDAPLFYELKSAREELFKIIKNTETGINEKAGRLLSLGRNVQNDIKKSPECARKIPFFAVFKNPELINSEWLKRLESPSCVPVRLEETAAENILTYFIYRYFLNAVYDREALPVVRLAVLGLLIPAYFGNNYAAMQLWSKETEHSDINMQALKENLRTAAPLCESALLQRLGEILM